MTIKTPESIADDPEEGSDHWVEEDVWKGHVIMPDVAKFNSKAFKVNSFASYKVIALPNIATAIFVAVTRS